jgi:hypothetical protein
MTPVSYSIHLGILFNLATGWNQAPLLVQPLVPPPSSSPRPAHARVHSFFLVGSGGTFETAFLGAEANRVAHRCRNSQ